jgi:membrane fusion protein (multidrug efflux system)
MTPNLSDEATPPQGVPVPLPAPRRRPALIVLSAGVVLVALVMGVRALRYARTHESTDDAQVDGHIVPVLARVGGYVSQVVVEDNASVKAGALLVRIDSTEYSIRFAQADADVAAATAAVAQAEAALESASQQRAAAQSQAEAARAAADRARADLARALELAATQVVSRQQLDAAQAGKDATEANLQAAQRQASAAAAAIAVAQAGVRAAQARLASSRAVRQNAALQLSYTRVVAPVGGTIAKRTVELGQLLQPGQPLLAVVADTVTWVTANFKETQLDEMRVGQKAEIDVDSYPGCTVAGTIESLSPATGARFALLPPDNATGNYTKVVQRIPVRIRVDRGCGSTQLLRPGLSVVVHVATR